MYKLVKEVFEDECSDLRISSPAFLKKLHQYQVGFVSKNDEHIAFFGGHLTGTERVLFTATDENNWFEDILEVNVHVLEEKLHALPDINPEFNVSSDVFNLSCAWLTHAVFNSDISSPKVKEQAMMDVMLIMNYRFITSRLYNHFRYVADREIAEQTYANLSNKFSLKIYGNWQKVLENRAMDTISKESIHYQTIVKMDNNIGVVKMLNDCQSRIRDMIKNIFDVFIRTKNSGMRIASTTSLVNYDGIEILKDRTNGLNNYTQYLKSVIQDRGSFIKEELVTAIVRIMGNMPDTLFNQVLEMVSDTYGRNGLIEEVVDLVMLHSFDYITENRSVLRNNVNLVGLLKTLRGVYTSSRSSNPMLLELRSKCEEIAFLATRNKNKNIIPALRTGLMLYLVSRAFTKNHYS